MSRSTTPTLHCDGDELGMCSEWSVDYYEITAHSVNGVRISATTRAPGWVSTTATDLCPNHAKEAARIAGGGDQ